jgi:uncharacterized protein with FMN-binding domain
MNASQSELLATLARAARKLALSAFVILSFLIYAVHERLAGPELAADTLPATPAATPHATLPPTSAPLNENLSTGTQSVQRQPSPSATVLPPTAVPASPTAAAASGQYKDGQYTGPRVNAFYGYVRVEADVVNGALADVRFLEYPSDRRTSQRINAVAVPDLSSEAIQAQSANVDIITGATLTSRAFAQSLQAALQSAVP